MERWYEPMWETSSTGSVSMFPYRMAEPGGAGRMLDSHSGEVMRRRLGAVVIIAPLSRTALESSGEVRISCAIVCPRASLCSCSGSSMSSGEDVWYDDCGDGEG